MLDMLKGGPVCRSVPPQFLARECNQTNRAENSHQPTRERT